MQTTTENKYMQPFTLLGKVSLNILGEAGAMCIFLFDSILHVFSSLGIIRKTVKELYFIGVRSITVISLIGLFTGMVIGLQTYYALSKFGSEGFLGAAVALSLVRELGPVLTAIMLTGRAGSSMTAEIGVMRISEQIDALVLMDINPMNYLVSPKLVASIISFPILTALFDLIGIVGGYISGVALLGGNSGVYFHRVHSSLSWVDISAGFYKSLVFAIIVCTICCFQGYFTHHRKDGKGAEGVSQATTTAVVMSCVMVLIADYVMTSLLF
ncbi:MlaE family ABC transporter permease [Maridesulfovibrio hydrothermalis]|uniref:Toluene transporter subunit: membrane component of ABC superfamily n=1 Tax=Maridesulfovibrio hydrothermalis AM13 = DSM 14728 TaxID=1121451 RepID=L0R7Q5_9BACT|nr:ABC transporter permease [Maridesulfovibrio hydrothermalis]CCO22769.1 toluene transporter subunit: membrane component of ABC superfamily [Maridesulfovibrio hydrothermalis AM13 = DSM 14728]